MSCTSACTHTHSSSQSVTVTEYGCNTHMLLYSRYTYIDQYERARLFQITIPQAGGGYLLQNNSTSGETICYEQLHYDVDTHCQTYILTRARSLKLCSETGFKNGQLVAFAVLLFLFSLGLPSDEYFSSLPYVMNQRVHKASA